MKKLLLLLAVTAMLPLASIFAQPDETYIKEHRGDTLVVKDDVDFGVPNSLYLLLLSDTNTATYTVPAGRVYMLHKSGYYSLINGITSANNRQVVIVGEDSSPLQTSKSADFPPVVAGAAYQGNNYAGGMSSNNDLVVKNINIELGDAGNGVAVWNWFGYASNARITVDNCILEHTFWVMFVPSAGSKTYIRNSYFVNMSGQACRRNGGVIDFFGDLDSLVVENSTHLISQGSMYKFRTGRAGAVIFNHNTFVDLAGYVFMNVGFQRNFAVTNNIFVNCNVQGYCNVNTLDPGEADYDNLPMGLVNVAYPDSIGGGVTADSLHFYVDKNLVYWDPTLTNATDGVIAQALAGSASKVFAWKSQMITMNTRTQAMFDNNATYKHLVEGTWIKDKLPAFKTPADLFTTQLTNIKAYAINKADTSSTAILPIWRLVNTPVLSYYTYYDWPIPVDLSYSDADIKTAGLGGFPLGDLNWFPAQKATWLAQRSAEYAGIANTLLAVKEVSSNLPNSFELSQNYPNPFNPSTEINYTIPKGAVVTLKVYDILGKEVATLVNQYQSASSYKVTLNGASLSTGVYFYKLVAGNLTMTKKMLLLK
ncbi:MAG TPA: T9SS type A sorting domain-containing protein [Bacteroidota bacterium]|nr:T9SS type A sorting domain-containing protein [Bacteroidota bacterium]